MKFEFSKGNQYWKLRKRSGRFKGTPSERKGRTKENYPVLKRISDKLKEGYKNNTIKCGFREGNHPSKKIENRKKSSKRMKENNPMFLLRGDKHPNWNNGSSFEPYSVDWTKTLKRAIKERDKFKCYICGNDNKLMVHHIDYNKKNCNSDNLITLCNSCHTKTNHNRSKWIEFFKEKLKCQ